MKFLENEIKQDEQLPESFAKSAAYASFAYSVNAQGNPLPTGAVNPTARVVRSFTLGENFAQSETGYVHPTTTYTTIVSNQPVNDTSNDFGRTSGDSTKAEQMAQSIQETSELVISRVNVNLVKFGSPTDNVVLAIQLDSGGSPSGIDLATASIAGSTLTGSYVAYNFDLNMDATIPANTKCWFILRRSGALSDTNYYNVQGITVSSYANGATKGYYSGTWNTGMAAVDLAFIIYQGFFQGRVYKTAANVSGKYDFFIGAASMAGFKLSTLNFIVAGEADVFTGLTPGSFYYLSDTAGAISSTPGTNSRKVGIGLSATSLLITNNW